MTDQTERRIEMLQQHQNGKDIITRLRSMVDVIMAGGEEGFAELAKEHPEPIRNALTSLMSMIERLQESNDQLLEFWLQSMDHNETIMNIIRGVKE